MISINAQALARQLFDAHDTYKEKVLSQRRFKHKDIVPLLAALDNQPPFTLSQIGESLEKRSIYQVKAGTGAQPILLWSQMHGDEATATMALFDIFNFLRATNDGFDDLRQSILSGTTLYFVPMLNPDGAERFQRRTAMDIDMNRDALRLQTPEGALLKSLQQRLQPLVGFNLHDQNHRYSVGKTGKQAVVSFLATAYDEARTINNVRARSMQLIVGMNRILQQFIPDQVARFDDEFEPRAFGDNIQKWGTTLILIESGGYKGDTEKMAIRRLNFVAILSALKAIADESYGREAISDYELIPHNGPLLFDVLIRNATVIKDGLPALVDIGINRNEVNKGANSFYYKSEIIDIGDLSIFYGLEEIDATGLFLQPARLYSATLNSVYDFKELDLESLNHEGVTVFNVGQQPETEFIKQYVHVLKVNQPEPSLCVGEVPTFLLTKDGQVVCSVVNGFWKTADKGSLGNGIVE